MFSFPVTVGPSALGSAAIPLGTQPPANGRLRRWKSTDKIYRQNLSKTRSNQDSPAVVGVMKMNFLGPVEHFWRFKASAALATPRLWWQNDNARFQRRSVHPSNGEAFSGTAGPNLPAKRCRWPGPRLAAEPG